MYTTIQLWAVFTGFVELFSSFSAISIFKKVFK